MRKSEFLMLEELKSAPHLNNRDVRRVMIAKYVVNCSIFTECQGTDQRRGLVPRRWWWEQRMCFDDV